MSARVSRLYSIWASMKQRCFNPNVRSYKYYGARGIGICDEWLGSFSAFEAWAVSHGYRKHLTIDRRNNDLGYSPDNCKWSTWKQQQRNKRNSYGGKAVRVTISITDPACRAKLKCLCISYGLCVSRMISKLIQDDMVRHHPTP